MEKMERFPVFFMKMILLISLLVTSVQAQDPEQSVINVNNITSWVRNDGFHPLKIIRLSDQNTGWNVSDDAEWLTVTPTSGSNNGTLTATYTANPTTRSSHSSPIRSLAKASKQCSV